MRPFPSAPLLSTALAAILVAGCGQNMVSPPGQLGGLAGGTQQEGVAFQQQQLHSRATALDRDNRELERLLAQTRQQNRLLQDELVAVRSQFKESNRLLAELRRDKQQLEEHTQSLASSVGRRSRATITANNSLMGRLSQVSLPGVEVRQDGDVIRVELPGQKLFHRGTATLQPGAAAVVDGIVAQVVRNYPEQIIGIEGHTDDRPIRTTQFPSNQHLSVSRAMSVYNHVTTRMRVAPEQFFVVGHGANHPVVSNATASGQSRNRRVELVIYPDRFGK